MSALQEVAETVVRKASAYRMIETSELHRALGIRDALPSEIATAAAALDAALADYEAARG